MDTPRINSVNDLREAPRTSEKMPVFFIGHGSPMNGIENNVFSRNWAEAARNTSVPRAVLCISAHWLTKGTLVTAMDSPPTIHDFGGFPEALYAVRYPAPGNPELAMEIRELVQTTHAGLDHEWGLDHGAWTVIRHMYPDARIPILQLSIDYHQPAEFHFRLGRELQSLRNKGVLIIGSGNMVHNLRMVAFDKLDVPGFGYDWAMEMQSIFREKILSGDYKALLDYPSLGSAARMAIPTPDHYWPLIYTLGLQEPNEETTIFNDDLVGGSITMTSVRFG